MLIFMKKQYLKKKMIEVDPIATPGSLRGRKGLGGRLMARWERNSFIELLSYVVTSEFGGCWHSTLVTTFPPVENNRDVVVKVYGS